jgi:epoxyqueuosine reductase
MSNWARVQDVLVKENYNDFSHAALTKPLSIEFYRSWLEQGFAGEMTYLQTHLPMKETPQVYRARARSAIVVQASYVPHPFPLKNFPLKQARLALYAQGEDYHHWLKQKLSATAERLKEIFPDEDFLALTDSSPVLERDLAYRAGLGWFGKNTCLIHPKKGSLFLIGEIYTSLSFSDDGTSDPKPLPDFCGTCTRCLDACPTQALTAPRTLDARKCISYLTIEAKQIPSKELRTKMGDWLFGCDICQTVCPWNLKWQGAELRFESQDFSEQEKREQLVADLRFILESSNKQLQKTFGETPLSRAAGLKLKRNALIVCANSRLTELKESVHKFLNHETLGELATWCLSYLN